VNLDDIAILLPTAIHKKTMRRNRRDRHLRHDVWYPQNFAFPNYRTWMQDDIAGDLENSEPQRAQRNTENGSGCLYNGSR
jgi:hypothetical protein